MTLISALALFGALALLAVIPGPGVFAVIARTVASGYRHGVVASIGIVVGDFVFIVLALMGLAALSEVMGSFFVVVKYLGAAYLLWLGLNLIFAKPSATKVAPVKSPGYLLSFAAGLFTTLGNPKAILFYLSFFPAFVDLANITIAETAFLFLIATVAVGGVMLCYVYATHKAQSSFSSADDKPILRLGSGSLLVGSGLWVALKN